MAQEPLATDTKEEVEEVNVPEPTEPIVVLRHHLYEALSAIGDALMLLQAQDITEAIRQSRPASSASPFARRLGRIEQMLAGYLSLNDEPVEETENDR